MKKSFIAAALIAAFVFASCEQSVLTGALPSGNAAIVNASNIAPQVTQPASWSPFTPLPFSTYADITSVAGLATDGANLVAAGYDRPNSTPYASFYNASTGLWSTPANLSASFAVNPGAAHYLNGYWLITGGSTSTTGAFSSNGTTWATTGAIGFGTKVGLYTISSVGGLYVVAGQGGQAAYARSLGGAFTQIPNSTTGWPSSGGAAYINAGAYGNGVYVFGGGSGRIAYTSNITATGTQWTGATITPPLATGDFINYIATNGGTTFVAVGNYANGQGFILYSTNSGQTWVPATSTGGLGAVTIYALAYGNGYFAAIDDAGNAAYSANGISWTNATDSAFTTASTLVNVAVYASGSTFYAAGENNGGVQIGVTR